MITMHTSTQNEFLVYKSFIAEYGDATQFFIRHNDADTVLDVVWLMSFPHSHQFGVRGDITGLFGNDFELVAKNGTDVIYKEKLTLT